MLAIITFNASTVKEDPAFYSARLLLFLTRNMATFILIKTRLKN